MELGGILMENAFEKLDKSMKNITLELAKYSEVHPEYQKLLNALAQQYLACQTLLALADDGINNTYFFKYADMDGIKTILTNAGYLEQGKKPASR